MEEYTDDVPSATGDEPSTSRATSAAMLVPTSGATERRSVKRHLSKINSCENRSISINSKKINEIYPKSAGFSKRLEKDLTDFANSIDIKDRLCILKFDEAQIRRSLRSNSKNIDGYADDNASHCTSVLTFLIESINGGWSIVHSYHFCSKTSVIDKKVELLPQVIKSVFNAGLIIYCIIGDRNNVGVYNIFSNGLSKQCFTYEHEDGVQHKIYLLYDFTHLIMNTMITARKFDLRFENAAFSWKVLRAVCKSETFEKNLKFFIESSTANEKRYDCLDTLLSNEFKNNIDVTLTGNSFKNARVASNAAATSKFIRIFGEINFFLRNNVSYCTKENIAEKLLKLNSFIKFFENLIASNIVNITIIDICTHFRYSLISLKLILNNLLVNSNLEKICISKFNEDNLELFFAYMSKIGNKFVYSPSCDEFRSKVPMAIKVVLNEIHNPNEYSLDKSFSKFFFRKSTETLVKHFGCSICFNFLSSLRGTLMVHNFANEIDNNILNAFKESLDAFTNFNDKELNKKIFDAIKTNHPELFHYCSFHFDKILKTLIETSLMQTVAAIKSNDLLLQLPSKK